MSCSTMLYSRLCKSCVKVLVIFACLVHSPNPLAFVSFVFIGFVVA